MGIPGDIYNEKILLLLSEVSTLCIKHSIPLWALANDTPSSTILRKYNVSSIILGVDTDLIRSAITIPQP